MASSSGLAGLCERHPGATMTRDQLLELYHAQSTPPRPTDAIVVWTAPEPGSTVGLASFLHYPLNSSSILSGNDIVKSVWIDLPTKRVQIKSNDQMRDTLTKLHHELETLRITCLEIQDDSTPATSKKTRREFLTQTFGARLHQVAKDDGGLNIGRWIIYKQTDNWANVFASLAWSLADPEGPLHKSNVVHTLQLDLVAREIYLYGSDAWSRSGAREVARILLTDHGIQARALKPSVYDLLGLRSQHWTKVRTSSFTFTDVLPGDAQEWLKKHKPNKLKWDSVWQAKHLAGLKSSPTTVSRTLPLPPPAPKAGNDPRESAGDSSEEEEMLSVPQKKNQRESASDSSEEEEMLSSPKKKHKGF